MNHPLGTQQEPTGGTAGLTRTLALSLVLMGIACQQAPSGHPRPLTEPYAEPGGPLSEIAARHPLSRPAPDSLRFLEATFRALPLHEDAARSLLDPLVLRAHDDELLVGDFGDMRVKRFDASGRLLATIGRGRGSGPGEFRNLTDVAAWADTVWVADAPGRALTAFRMDGTLIERFSLPFMPTRIAVGPAGLFVLALGGDAALMRLGPGGVPRVLYEDLTERAREHASVIVNGYLLAEPVGVAYVPESASRLYRFDARGAVAHVYPTPGGRGFPALTLPADGGPTTAPDPSSVALQPSRDAQGYAVPLLVREIRDRLTGETLRPGALLLHRLRPDGAYEGTLRLPPGLTAVSVQGERLWGLEDSRLVALEIATAGAGR
ncbi:MAG: hypothetical protein ACK41D_10470 [Rubricoccaceae bacterium]